MKKVLSLCIAMAIILGLFSSCANPPWGKTPADETLPRPADQPSEENTNAEPDPVDLSGLTEKELGKINPYILEEMKNKDASSDICVCIILREPLSSQEFEEAVDARLKLNEQKSKEIANEIDTLTLEKEKLTEAMDENNTQLQSSISNIDSRINELNAELLKYGTSYGYGVSGVLAEQYKPILLDFIKTYGLPEDSNVIPVSMLIRNVTLSSQKIVEIVKDDTVRSVEIPEKDDGLKHHGPQRNEDINVTSTSVSSTPHANDTYVDTDK